MNHKKLKITLLAAGCVLAVLGFAVIGTTRVDRAMGMTSSEHMSFYENDTFKFTVAILPNDCVDHTCHGFWVRSWPANPKCAAAVNFPLRGHQVKFSVLRWGWRG